MLTLSYDKLDENMNEGLFTVTVAFEHPQISQEKDNDSDNVLKSMIYCCNHHEFSWSI